MLKATHRYTTNTTTHLPRDAFVWLIWINLQYSRRLQKEVWGGGDASNSLASVELLRFCAVTAAAVALVSATAAAASQSVSETATVSLFCFLSFRRAAFKHFNCLAFNVWTLTAACYPQQRSGGYNLYIYILHLYINDLAMHAKKRNAKKVQAVVVFVMIAGWKVFEACRGDITSSHNLLGFSFLVFSCLF